MPGQPDNANRMRTGARSLRHDLALVDLGKRYPSVYYGVLRLRRHLEAEILRLHDSVTIGAAAAINRACRYETVARIAGHLVASGQSTSVTVDMRTMVWATAQRDLCLDRLGIGPEQSTGAAESLDWDKPASEEAIDRAIHGGRATAPADDDDSANHEAGATPDDA